MSNASLDRQVDDTVKILLTLLTEPRIKANELALMLDRTPNHIARMIMRFRDAGLDISYDWSTESYTGKFTEQLKESILGEFSKKLKKAVRESEQTKPPQVFVSSLARYTPKQFAEQFGTTPQNVYNMISEYKGQGLPTGWVAYQLKERGNWFLMKMETDRSGKKYLIPAICKDAFSYKVGTGKPATLEGNKDRTKELCVAPECGEERLGKGLCKAHYYQARRHPERFAEFQRKAGFDV
jgi:hypothetical protein